VVPSAARAASARDEIDYCGHRCPSEEQLLVIILGVILIILGYVLSIPILYTIGIILAVVGLILTILGAVGRGVGGRKTYF
jgi:hypothetical protein